MAFDIMYVTKLCLLLMTAIHTASCDFEESDRVELYPFGKKAGDTELFGDDNSSGAINIGTFKYFGSVYSKLFVNTNGVLSFGKEAKSRALTKSNFPKKRGTPPTIAPFWNDIDIREGGRIWYRQSTDNDLLIKASIEIDQNWIEAAWLFVATWHEVRFHGANYDGRFRRNTFQVVLATDASRERSYAIFNYHRLNWASSVTNLGRAENGLGGTSPGVAGFDSGNGTDFVELPKSFTTDVRRIVGKSNVGIYGKWIFNIENKPIKDICYKNGPCKRGACYTDGITADEKCNCDNTGFDGTTCSNDKCDQNSPCKRGKCYTVAHAVVKCSCQGTGFHGPTCSIETCDKNGPCKRGKCYLDEGDDVEKCDCRGTGFQGQTCDIDYCYQNGPCNRGKCYIDGNDVVKCNCNGTGFHGPTCNIDVCSKCPGDQKYAPVCGSDGQTVYHRCVIETRNCKNHTQVTVLYEGTCAGQRLDFAAARGDEKLQPHAMVLLVANGLYHVIHYM